MVNSWISRRHAIFSDLMPNLGVPRLNFRFDVGYTLDISGLAWLKQRNLGSQRSETSSIERCMLCRMHAYESCLLLSCEVSCERSSLMTYCLPNRTGELWTTLRWRRWSTTGTVHALSNLSYLQHIFLIVSEWILIIIDCVLSWLRTRCEIRVIS